MHEFSSDRGAVIRVQTWDVGAPVPIGLEDFLGVSWPLETGDVAAGRASRTAMCVAPGDWLVLGQERERTAAVTELHTALAASSYRATDVSQLLLRMQVGGDAACAVLAKGCSLDLDTRAFGVGRATRTRLAGIPVVVWRVGNDAFECLLTRSYGEYFQAWLDDAALEFDAAG